MLEGIKPSKFNIYRELDGIDIGNWFLEIRHIKKVWDLGNSISKILKIILKNFIRPILYFENIFILKIKNIYIFFLIIYYYILKI